MVAVVSSLVFIAAIFVALGVILSMIGAERDRILGLLSGSFRDIALPPAIPLRTRPGRYRPRPVLVPAPAAA